MTTTPTDANSDFLDGLLWYLEIRNWAFDKIRSSPHGSHLIDAKMHHHLYFSNLFSAVDLVRDYSVQSGVDHDVDGAIRQGFVGTEDYEYARELRNAIVHRGFNVAAAGHGDNSFVYTLCPSSIRNRSGSKELVCSVLYTTELIKRCNQIVSPVLLNFLEDNSFLTHVSAVKKIDVLKAFCDSTAPPPWAKVMATRAFEELDYEQMIAVASETRAKRIRQLLSISHE